MEYNYRIIQKTQNIASMSAGKIEKQDRCPLGPALVYLAYVNYVLVKLLCAVLYRTKVDRTSGISFHLVALQ